LDKPAKSEEGSNKQESSKKAEDPAERLVASRFRFLNEQLYTQPAREAQEIFKDDEESFKARSVRLRILN
jgi:hypothetical protein